MKQFRKERVASVIRNIVSGAIGHRLNDPRIEPLTTVTRVEMTGDLEIAKIFLSVPGGEAVERRTLTALRHATGFLQRIVGHELALRQCPEIRFEIDAAVKLAKETMELLAENRRLHPELFVESVEDRPDEGSDDVEADDVEESNN